MRRAYELYILRSDGRIGAIIPLEAADDQSAVADGHIRHAEGLCEVWCGNRLVARFSAGVSLDERSVPMRANRRPL